jgi:hypothetical protein
MMNDKHNTFKNLKSQAPANNQTTDLFFQRNDHLLLNFFCVSLWGILIAIAKGKPTVESTTVFMI